MTNLPDDAALSAPSAPPPAEPLDIKTILMLDTEIRAFLSKALDGEAPTLAGEIASEGKGKTHQPIPIALYAMCKTLHHLILEVGSPKQQQRFGDVDPEDYRTNLGLHRLAIAFRLAVKDKTLIGAIGPRLHELARQAQQPSTPEPPPPMPEAPARGAPAATAPMPPTPPRSPAMMRAV